MSSLREAKLCRDCSVVLTADNCSRAHGRWFHPCCRPCANIHAKERYRANKSQKIKSQKAYSQTEAGKKAKRTALDNQRAKYPEKVKARSDVYQALKKGVLVRPNNCSKCHAEVKPEAHHVDYTKPLVVVWLCGFCHKEVHYG